MKDIPFLPISFFTRYISRDVELVVPPSRGKILFRAFHCPYVEEHSNEVNFFLGKEAVRKFGRSIHQCF